MFCLPGEQGAHEQGGVEGEVGVFRRNHWVPVPQARDLVALNEQLLAAGQEDERRLLAGREQPVGAAMLLERAHLLPVAEEDFELAEISFPLVSSLGTVKVRTNAYSVPLPAGTRIEARIRSASIQLW